MDHMQRPADPLYEEVIVPCLDSKSYDGADFETYPARRGWDRARLLAGDFTEQSPARTAAFLQDWLYFGIFWIVLGERGSKLRYTQPWPDLSNGRVATTSLDRDFARSMTDIKHGLQYNSTSSRYQMESVQRALKLLSFLSRYRPLTEDNVQHAADIGHWPLSAEVDFSIRVLGSYLAAGTYSALWCFVPNAALSHLKFGAGSLPDLRMIQAAWCPSDRTMALEQFSPAALYYASSLRRSSGSRNHSGCTTEMCFASQVDTGTYETVHTRTTCECLFLGPLVERVAAIINSENIPLILLSVDQGGNVSIKVRPSATGQKYVAFSHVWSDGLGNPLENKLPICQLRRLRSMLLEMDQLSSALSLLNRGHAGRLWRRSRGMCMPFWIDTLCVPVGEEYRTERSRAIAMMKQTYEQAYQVLVLDTELETYSLQHAGGAHGSSGVEAMMRVSLSGWMRRLWTLQEGVLARGLHVKFKDSILNLESTKRALVDGPEFSSIAAQIKTTHGTIPTSATQFHVRMKALRSSVVDTHEPRFLGIRTRYYSMHEAEATETRIGFAIMEAFIASRFRTTSRQADEYICLASLLGWDTTMLSSIPIEQRMKHLFSKVKRLPQGLIFLPGPRMSEPGWSWAVTRFGNPGWKTQWSAPINDFRLAERNRRGLTVYYPGIILPYSLDLLPSTKGMIHVPGPGGTPLGDCVFEFHWLKHEKAYKSNSPESARGPQDRIVLFYAPSGTLSTGASIAAVVVSVSTEHRPRIFRGDADITCSFQGICQLRAIDSSYLPDGASSSRGLQSSQDATSLVAERRWIIQ